MNDIKTYYLSGAGVARYVTGQITRAFEFLAGTPGAGHEREDFTGEPVKY